MMCGDKYKHDMLDEQFPLGNFEQEDDQNAFIENAYEGVIAKPCRPLKTQPKSAPKKPKTYAETETILRR